MFLDEKIAKLQKNEQRLKACKQAIQTQLQEVSKIEEKEWEYEKVICLDEKICMTLPKDFFEIHQQEENYALWSKTKVLSIITYSQTLQEQKLTLEEIKTEVEAFGKEQEIYIKVVQIKEDKLQDFKTGYLKVTMPTALGYVFQVQYILYTPQEAINFIATYLQKRAQEVEPIVEHIIKNFYYQGKENECGS